MAVLNLSPVQTPTQQATASAKSQPYQADQQLKYLHLQAEVEVLLQQLQALKQRRQGMEAGDVPYGTLRERN